MGIRNYRNGPATALTSGVGPSDVSMTVDDASGFPSLTPYTLIVDKDQSTEEVVDVTAQVGNLLTVSRGVDGTTAFSHAAGAVVAHGISARDPSEANTHVNAVSDTHGVTGALVGTTMTQTLSGKTLTAPTINNGTMTGTAISGGTIAGSRIQEASILRPTTGVAKVAFQDSGGVERGFVDGTGNLQASSVQAVNNTDAAKEVLKATGHASQSANLLTVQDNSSNAALNVSAARRVGVNGTPSASITLLAKAVAASDVVFRAGGAISQTGDYIQAVDSSASVKFSVASNGDTMAAGDLAVTGSITSADLTDWAAFGPNWVGLGGTPSATLGRWKRIGKKTVAFNAELAMSTAGAGSTNVQFDLPTNPSRGLRQSFTGHAEAPGGSITGVTFTSGSGKTVDRLLFVSGSTSTTLNLIGSMLGSSSVITVSGVYEEA